MANTTKQLTNTEVNQAKPKEKEYNLADGGGLALRVKPTGSKIWIFNYSRPFTKKRTNLGFGIYPDVSLAEARTKGCKARELLAKDIDPKTYKIELDQKETEALENTFGILAEKWKGLKKKQVKQRTIDKAWQSLEKHVLPSLKDSPVKNIKPKMVIDILQPVSDNGKYETVKRLIRSINEIMRLAVASGLIEINYLTDLTKLFPAPIKTNMATIPPDELPDLMTALASAKITDQTRIMFKWQLHTMTRPIEAATAKWEDVDLDNKVWIIPANRMKMKKPHTIPLTEQTLALIELIKPISKNREYLFPGQRNPRSHANSASVNMAIKRMGYKGKLVSHGLRSIASTALNEQGFNPDVIESALAHIDKNEVRRAYNRSEYLEQRRKLMCWWSESIEKASTGKIIKSGKKNLKIVNN